MGLGAWEGTIAMGLRDLSWAHLLLLSEGQLGHGLLQSPVLTPAGPREAGERLIGLIRLALLLKFPAANKQYLSPALQGRDLSPEGAFPPLPIPILLSFKALHLREALPKCPSPCPLAALPQPLQLWLSYSLCCPHGLCFPVKLQAA